MFEKKPVNGERGQIVIEREREREEEGDDFGVSVAIHLPLRLTCRPSREVGSLQNIGSDPMR